MVFPVIMVGYNPNFRKQMDSAIPDKIKKAEVNNLFLFCCRATTDNKDKDRTVGVTLLEVLLAGLICLGVCRPVRFLR